MPNKIADPLTTADQYDLARALTQAAQYAFQCSARLSELVDAVTLRDALAADLKKQLESNRASTWFGLKGP